MRTSLIPNSNANDDFLAKIDAIDSPLTVAEYADAKALPEPYLREIWGLRDSDDGIIMPYRREDGSLFREVLRRSISHGKTAGKPFTQWLGESPKGSKTLTLPYGLHNLRQIPSRECFLVEGESDTQTLHHHTWPVIGLKGADGWQNNFAELQAIKDVRMFYAIKEPDAGGEEFIAKLARSPIRERVRVMTLPEGIKDVSELHVKYPSDVFETIMQAAYKDAQPIPEPTEAERVIVPDANKMNRYAEVIEQTLRDASIGYYPRVEKDGGYMWALKNCLFNFEHQGGTSVAVFVGADGQLGFNCKRPDCSKNGWKQFRAKVEEQLGRKLVFEEPPIEPPRSADSEDWQEPIGTTSQDEQSHPLGARAEEPPHTGDSEEGPDEPSEQETDLNDSSELNDDSEVSLGLAIPKDAALRPKLSEEALYGLAGDIVKKIIPQTESHPAGLLVQTLMYFGNIIGKTAYYMVESDKHFGNIFAVRVGDSSKGRKGTGAGRINAVFENVDPYWFAERRCSGLSTGEGVVTAVQDAVYAADKKTGELQLIDSGVKDKRLAVYEGEFAQVLAVMQRQGATLSPIIRNAWDGMKLQIITIVKRVSTGHHISIMGDITGSELKRMLTHQDSENGFANRFLWVHVERTKLLPFGGEELDFTAEVERLQTAITFAKRQRRIFMDDAARKVWHRAYPKLAVAHEGLFGKIVSRGEPQVLRLSMLFALLDCSEHIRPEHLRAGLAVWKYCEDSARYVFDAITEDQKTLLEFLKENGTQTATGIYKNLYSKNRKAEIIHGDLNALVRHKLAGRRKNGKGVAEFRAI